jgi:hypothetical protein
VAQHAPARSDFMRLALFTFAFLASLGVVIGHASLDKQNMRVDDRGAKISVKH